MTQPDHYRGAKIGTRIAHVVSQAIVSTHTKLMHVRRKLAKLIFDDITNEISDEFDQAMGPLLRGMYEAHQRGGPAEGLLHFMAHGRGQFKAIVGSSSTAQSLLWALGTVISNELAPIAYGYIETNPHLIPDPATIAGFAATGRIDHGDAVAHIAQNGFQPQWAERWIDAQRAYPTIADASEMLHRHAINRAKFDEWGTKNGLTPEMIEAYFETSTTVVSMQDAAIAYLRGAISKELLYGLADQNGYTSADVDVYLDTVGEPPGTMDMLEAWRRNLVTEEDVVRGIKQSRVRDEWIPMIKGLRYSPMSTADAVNAVVQNHIPMAAGEAIADQNGLEPGSFGTLYENAGAPLSRTEVNQLYNMGLIGSDVVLQALRESRLKDKYGQDAFALRRRLLEPRVISTAVHNGVIDHAVGIHKAMEHGFNAEDAAILVGTASSMKTERFRDAIVREAETLYIDGGITREEVKSVAGSMGYEPQEAELLTVAADYHREQKVFTGAVNAIRAKYIGHHIDVHEASNRLDSLGMPAVQRDFLLHYWQVEAAANVRSLTQAQVAKAIKKQLITPEEGLARYIAMGYSEEDAALLLEEI